MYPAMEEREVGDIVEPEEWRNPEEQQFNHQLLVMNAMRKCLDSGSVELREGWWEEKVDKMGNIHKTWHEDTRRVFVESVKTLIMFMETDYDDEAKKIIPELIKKIGERKEYWLSQEWEWWQSLSVFQKNQLSKEGKAVVKGFFNRRLDFDNYFFEDETNLYRQICSELNKLTYRLDYYGAVGYMG